MANWYCDYTNGNDTTGSGTSGSPYKTVQKCVNVATGGDTINIANTSAQVLSAAISWSSGWTADNTKYTYFQSWDNGGALQIQKPNEPAPRVGAYINGNNAAVFFFSTTSIPDRIICKNLKFYNNDVAGNPYMFINSSYSGFFGCEFDGSGTACSFIYESGVARCSHVNNYYHSSTNAANSLLRLEDSIFSCNYISDITLNSSSRVIVDFLSVVSVCLGNLIQFSGSGKGISSADYTSVVGNTIIGNSASNQIGATSASGTRQQYYNNLFYKFDGTSSKPLDISSSPLVVGYNAFFDCNANTLPSQIAQNLTAFDVTGVGDPFVDSGNDDFAVTGSTAANAGLGNP